VSIVAIGPDDLAQGGLRVQLTSIDIPADIPGAWLLRCGRPARGTRRRNPAAGADADRARQPRSQSEPAAHEAAIDVTMAARADWLRTETRG
jgi:hypothetical protein